MEKNAIYTAEDKEWEFIRESNAVEEVYDKDSLNQAIYAWEYLKKKPRIDYGDIMKVHKILMLHQPIVPNERGYIRYRNVTVGGYLCPAPELINSLLQDWLDDYYDPRMEFSPIEAHIRFEKIHPFIDGNGRVGRLLYLWHCVKKGLGIDILRESEKEDYYNLFRR